jgi:galactokinase
MKRNELLLSFAEHFGTSQGARVFFAPGRVNLIGEHTDYNGGHVFPCALSFGTYMVAKKNGSKQIRALSLNFQELGILTAPVDGIAYDKAFNWLNYPLGVTKTLQDKGLDIHEGFDILVYGNIPNGAGLSSSASVELATGIMLEGLFGFKMDRVELVKVCQFSENHFNGVNCGIMDQFAIGMGKKNHAVLLDCDTLDYEYAPLELDGYSIVISNTNKRRELGESKYNERRMECERALKQLQTEADIKSLGELTVEAFEALEHLIDKADDVKRARHAVSENQRALRGVSALKEGDILAFGKLMDASHISLRDDYEVTGIELDTLVELAWEHTGVIGSRMTGAGFGGCTVSIVQSDQVDDFMASVGKLYEEKIGYAPSFYIADVSDGARELRD